MTGPPEKKLGEDGLPIPPYAVYNIGNSNPGESDCEHITEELIRAEVLPADYDFLRPIRNWYLCAGGMCRFTYADTFALEHDFEFKPGT